MGVPHYQAYPTFENPNCWREGMADSERTWLTLCSDIDRIGVGRGKWTPAPYKCQSPRCSNGQTSGNWMLPVFPARCNSELHCPVLCCLAYLLSKGRNVFLMRSPSCVCVCVCVCVCQLSSFETDEQIWRNFVQTLYRWRPLRPPYFLFPTISNNNMSDARTYEVWATIATLNIGSWNDAW
jgi:hypothetical protein